MAVNPRPTPDDFNKPQAHSAAPKAAVTAVLEKVTAAGSSLLSLFTGLLAAVMILYSGYVLYDTFYTQGVAASTPFDLLQYRPEIIDDGASPLAGADTLAKVNQDYRAWLTVYDTYIDYPVMQGPNDFFYANHDVYGLSSLTGSIYLSAGNQSDLSDSYNLIYGHHMDNLASMTAMFGALDEYVDETYARAHREGVLVSPTGVYDLYVFAVAQTDAYESAIYSVGDRMGEVTAFLDAPGDSTDVLFYDADALDGAKKIVALSTCADAETNGRLVVFATMTLRNLITLDVQEPDSAVYDGTPHGLDVTTNYPDGTTIEYSTDGGTTWTTEPPTRTDAGTTTVVIRATNDSYGETTATAHITVAPAEVTVTAQPTTKTYGTDDPANPPVTVTGLVGDDTIDYTVGITGDHTNAGEYPGAITVTGDENQGNYHVTYVSGDLTVAPSSNLVATPTVYDGPYDGEDHPIETTTNVPEGTTIEYSTDGGNTWTTEPPSQKDVGEQEVIIRATNPNYEPYTTTVTLKVVPAEVTVTAQPTAKTYGTEDPAFPVTVTGLVGDDTIDYTVSAPGDHTDAGEYPGAITVTGDEYQGNYHITYVSGDLTVEPSDGLTLTPTVYDGPYDGEDHPIETTTNVPEGTTIEYSTDGGETWTTEPPSQKDVGEQEVVIRATNPNYDPVTTTVTLRVVPAEVTVTANPTAKTYGTDDPDFPVTVTGLVGDDTIDYTVSAPGNHTEAGEYPGAIVVSGDEYQGNYHITYVSGDLTVAPSDSLVVTPTVYDGPYDGEDHPIETTTNVPEGTTIEYSTDGGETWTTEPPSQKDVGEQEVVIRATNPNYDTYTTTVTLKVEPREVTVTANPTTKTYGTDDPNFPVTVTGLVGDDTIDYTVSAPGNHTDAGEYPGAIAVTGDEYQGNYHVTYVSGDLTVAPSEGLTLTPTVYDGPYDGEDHPIETTTNVPEGTTIEYSTDGGRTWTTEPPSQKDVGEQEVVIRATNPNYDPVTTTVTLKVVPREVTVSANPTAKTYGADDPNFPVTVTGLVGGDTIDYTVAVTGDPTEAGTYPGAIAVTGDEYQGNYHITYVSGDLTIAPSGGMSADVDVYDGPYDGQDHPIGVTPNIPEGTTVEYSTDGGRTWTTTPPSQNNVGEQEVMIRVTNPNYDTYTTTVTLRVDPRAVTVTANDASKQAGTADPTFSATVSGLLPGDTIQYTVGRAGGGDAAGIYRNAIVPSGAEYQGNYRVTYVPATLTITTPEGAIVYPVTPTAPEDPDGPDTPDVPEETTEPPAEEIEDTEAPLAQFFKRFDPLPREKTPVWALVNLLCMLATLYILLPLAHLKAKFGRVRMMKKINLSKEELREAKHLEAQELAEKAAIERQAMIERARAAGIPEDEVSDIPENVTAEEFSSAVETLYFKVKRFLKRFRIGLGIEIVDVAAAVIAFVLTEDIRRPMVLIDQWTPLMIVLMAVCWIADSRLLRYRSKSLAEELSDLRAETEHVRARAGQH